MKKIFISQSEKDILENILSGDFEVLLFGSRVKGDHQKFSDLDICIKGKSRLSRDALANFRLQLSDSALPYTVDLIDYNAIDESFRKLIDAHSANILQTKAVN